MRAYDSEACGKLFNGMTAKRTCLLVLGMHQSGTSALTRVLSLLGAALPGRLMKAGPDNSLGYWESSSLMEVNDELLTAAGSCWDDWAAFDEDLLGRETQAAFEARIGSVIKAEFGDAPLIVLKDPRIARMVPLYLRILDGLGYTVRCLLITRHPREVAQSLALRNGFSEDQARRLWLRHTLDAEYATRETPRLLLTYDALISESRTVVEQIAAWGADVGLSTDPDWSDRGDKLS